MVGGEHRNPSWECLSVFADAAEVSYRHTSLQTAGIKSTGRFHGPPSEKETLCTAKIRTPPGSVHKWREDFRHGFLQVTHPAGVTAVAHSARFQLLEGVTPM